MCRFRVGIVLVCLAVAACGSVGNQEDDAGVRDAAVVPDAALDAAADAAIDAVPDAALDAPAGVRFAVGYVDDVTLTPDIHDVFGFVAIVNTGTLPLDLSTANVATFEDDSMLLDWTFAKTTGSTAMLNPNRAAGKLTPAAKAQVVASDVIVEPFDETVLEFTMTAHTTQPELTVNAKAVLSIGGVNVTLPIVITIAAGRDASLNSARRVSSGT